MTQDKNILDSSKPQKDGVNKHPNPNTEDIGRQISDTELEPASSQDIENNLESELSLDDYKKNELITQLKGNNELMKTEIDKITRIAATTQSQYLSLKNEFDSYIKRIDTEKKEIKLLELKKIASKFTKLLEQLRLFFQSLNSQLHSSNEIKGLQLIYESFIGQELAQMGIFQIQSLGFIPNTEMHEVLMIQEANQGDLDRLLENNIKLDGEKDGYNLEELGGHIIGELEVGYYYFDGEKKIIIKPSKVIVAQ